MNHYEAKREAKAERYEELAEKNRQASDSRYQSAKSMADMIPFGQPVLVGHHSERGHRAHLSKIDTNMRKSIEHSDKADYYANKAENARNNTAISSDDPEAIAKMKAKIDTKRKEIEISKRINARLRKMKTRTNAEKEIEAMEDSDPDKKLCKAAIENSFYASRVERINAYYLSTTHANAEIKRLEERIRQLEKVESMETKEEVIGDVRVVRNTEENRLQLFYPSKPDEETRKKIKRYGFKWSPTAGAWQRLLNGNAIYSAKMLFRA